MKAAEKRIVENLKVSLSDLQSIFDKTNVADTISKIKKEASSILNNVKFPAPNSHEELSLVMLFLAKGKLLHKDDIARVGSSYLGEKQSDWQVRHLSAQKGFYIIGKGDIIPNTNICCPSGYHSLVTLDGISPKFGAIKRLDLLSNLDFEQIKNVFGGRCAHCNSKEGEKNFRDSSITKLQKGHINPNLSLEVGNILPLCDYCNRTYKDTYLFLPSGGIDRPNVESERVSRLLINKITKAHGKEKILSWLKSTDTPGLS